MILEVLAPFILTFIIESAILPSFIKTSPIRVALYAFLINALTWPVAVILSMSFPMLISLIVIEVGVVLAETVLISLLFEIGRGKSLAASCLANFISAIIGFPLFWLIFWLGIPL